MVNLVTRYHKTLTSTTGTAHKKYPQTNRKRMRVRLTKHYVRVLWQQARWGQVVAGHSKNYLHHR